MNMFRAFMELDTIYESLTGFYDRQELIDKLKAFGKYYKFDKYTNKQLYRILEKELIKQEKEAAFYDFYSSRVKEPTCDQCGCRLSDGSYCPVCDDGEEDI